GYFWNDDIMENRAGVLQTIAAMLGPPLAKSPHPNPPPRAPRAGEAMSGGRRIAGYAEGSRDCVRIGGGAGRPVPQEGGVADGGDRASSRSARRAATEAQCILHRRPRRGDGGGARLGRALAPRRAVGSARRRAGNGQGPDADARVSDPARLTA